MDIKPTRAIALTNALNRQSEVISDLENEIEYLKREVICKDLPSRVIEWMIYYDSFCWELFFCYEHNEFYTELDALFPYHMEMCRCGKCADR